MPDSAPARGGAAEADRLRVAWVGGPLPVETGHMTSLAQDVDLLVVTSTGPGHEHAVTDVPGVRVRAVPAYGSTDEYVRWVYPTLGMVLSDFAPDVVHVVIEPWGLLPLHAAMWVRRHRPCALVLHGCDRIWWHGGPLERISKRALAWTSLRAATGFCAETLAATEVAAVSGLRPGLPRAQIHTNPRHPGVFRPAMGSERLDARRRLGLPEQGPGVAFIGRLVEEKGPLLLLDAWASLPPQTREGAWLALAGEGPIEAAVAARAAQVPGAFFLGRIDFPRDVVDLCRAAEVVAVPSYRTGEWDDQSPRTVIEGLLSGAIVVGARSGGIPVMLGAAGVLVDEQDAPDLARGLSEALHIARDPAALAVASGQAVEQGRGHYSVDTVAEQLLTFWRRCPSR